MSRENSDIFTVLKRVESPSRAKARQKESPVYQDCYGRQVASLLRQPASKENQHAE